MKKRNLSLLLFSLFLFLAACNIENEIKVYRIENIDFTLEGPLFEGANSGQYEHVVDLNQLFDNAQSSGNIKEAKLISCQIVSSDSSDFRNISSFVLQLTAEKADMIEIAVLNPVSGGKVANLKSSEKDIGVFFNQNKFILLIDASLKKDQEENLKFKANLVFEVKVNQ